MIRLIATDLDGTLLEPDGTLPDGTYETVEELTRAAAGSTATCAVCLRRWRGIWLLSVKTERFAFMGER